MLTAKKRGARIRSAGIIVIAVDYLVIASSGRIAAVYRAFAVVRAVYRRGSAARFRVTVIRGAGITVIAYYIHKYTRTSEGIAIIIGA